MSLKIFLRRIMILLKAKYSFDKIKETEIVIYDKNGSEIFSELLYDNDWSRISRVYSSSCRTLPFHLLASTLPITLNL